MKEPSVTKNNAALRPNLSTTNGNDCDKTTKVWRSRSVTDSPRSIDSPRNRQFSSPLRISRNVQSPSLDSGDEGSLRVDRDTYQHMFQDIVSIKTMLLKLKRVLQEVRCVYHTGNDDTLFIMEYSSVCLMHPFRLYHTCIGVLLY